MNTEHAAKLAVTTLENYQTKRMTGSSDIVMPGYFSGSRVMFIAQNPGQLKDSVPEDVEYAKLYHEFFTTTDPVEKLAKWKEMQDVYVAALRSPKGSLGLFINDVYGEDWSDISITNVYKCPFVGNIVPQLIPGAEIQLLCLQIDIVKPDVIVYVGKIAEQASLYQNYHPRTLHVQHPSYLRKTGRYYDTVSLYAAQLDNLLNVST